MKNAPWGPLRAVACACLLLCGRSALAQTNEPVDDKPPSLESLQRELADTQARLQELKRSIQQQEAHLRHMRRALGMSEGRLDTVRGAGAPGVAGEASQIAQNDETGTTPVGKPPEPPDRPPRIAQIFDEPSALTPPGKVVVEPSLQMAYSSSDRVALVGYTIIPALLIGLIDVRQVKTTTLTGTVAVRYGLARRWELEARVPYVYSSSDTVSSELFTGTATDRAFSSHGHGIGDVELTARYQLNAGGVDKPFYIGWLRFKTRTGKDPFEVTTDCVTRCVSNTTGTGLPLQQPTGSGFFAVQPGLTWLFPTDPAVFFGSISYLHNFERKDVSLNLVDGSKQFLGNVKAGDIIGLNFGMGLALNEKASFSIGYDQSIIAPTKQNGERVPGPVRTILGTLLVGYSYRISPKMTLNLSVGAGLTRDTPDLTVTLRLPIQF
ncbi:acetate kinase [Ralstonia pickettii]|uniref:Acetate kinase n=1 Tax=Ralstonia pickettii TaxID=329 RepID=A0A9Q2GZW4_RALPI|nr:acetate kinase [Ralstonia pickettii]MBA9845127.1 acetate kinase [Ralstonia pickettii]MBA9852713.1 acetate kinase [Ralstonia pickettii]MBA9881780.1 acetate kinase [Ralstonia pickettii]MBA9891897.1 acetate kinase [Ralstonia pickettii]MBA9918441.1 acetate kinase [Ralstonia pickettii]